MISPVIAKSSSTSSSVSKKYESIVPSASYEWEAYFTEDQSYSIEKYQSIIPTGIIDRPVELTEQLFILGIERIDLPKLPNGKPVKWWFLVQQFSCKSCIFLSKLDVTDRTRKCLNPRVTQDAFSLYIANEEKCPEWYVGIDSDRLLQEKLWGYNEQAYLVAGLTKTGISSPNFGLNVPAIGGAEAYKFTLALAESADFYNACIYYYLQAYYLKQSGHNIDNSVIVEDPTLFLPEIIGENFVTDSTISTDINYKDKKNLEKQNVR